MRNSRLDRLLVFACSLVLSSGVGGCFMDSGDGGAGESAQEDTVDSPPLAFEDTEGVWEEGIVPGPGGPDLRRYRIVGDHAVVDGDIAWRLDYLEEYRRSLESPEAQSAYHSDAARRWPAGVVPFVLSTNLTTAEQGVVNAAINAWNNNSVIRLVTRRGTESDYVFIQPGAVGSGCWSDSVGRIGGRQVVNLARPNMAGVGCMTAGTAIHEIGHAVGLYHEQQRSDRGSFITVNLGNIDTTTFGDVSGNFATYPSGEGVDHGPYDYGSIMHYSANAFALPGQNTIVANTPLPAGVVMGQRNGLSPGDLRGVSEAYGVNGTNRAEIVYASTGACVDLPGGSTSDGEQFQVFPCHRGPNQQFVFFRHSDGTFSIRNETNGRCLEVESVITPPGEPPLLDEIQQHICNGNSRQRFRLENTAARSSTERDLTRMRPASDLSRCVAVRSSRLVLSAACLATSEWQIFGHPPAGQHQMVTAASRSTVGRGEWCTDIEWDSTASGAAAQHYPCKYLANTNQMATFNPDADGRHYQIQMVNGGRCLQGDTPVTQRTCSTVDGQRFALRMMTGGGYHFVPASGELSCIRYPTSTSARRLSTDACNNTTSNAAWWVQ
jgi:hypothetical protein